MSLTEYLLRRNERPITWCFVRAWIPRPAERYSWLRLLCVILGTTGFASLVSVALCTPFPSQLSWVVPTFAELGALVGLCWGLLSRVCWNQRAARLAGGATSADAEGASWPKRGFLNGILPSIFYAILVGFVTPVLLFHGIENARGAWAWHQTRTRLKAAGECIDLACVIPPPARDEENFFATPFWTNFLYQRVTTPDGRNVSVRWNNPNHEEVSKNFSLPQGPVEATRIKRDAPSDGRTDLAGWALAFRSSNSNAPKSKTDTSAQFPVPPVPGDPAADILLALSKFDPILSEFSAAAARPRNRYPVLYDDGFSTLLPHLAVTKSAVLISRLRALAKLSQGNTAGATADALLGFRISDSLTEDSLLITELVRYACDAITTRTVWEGMVGHRWNEAQLLQFQTLFSKREYGTGIVRALEAERAYGIFETEKIIHEGVERWGQLTGPPESGDTESGRILRPGSIMPVGWWRANQVALVEGYQRIIATARSSMMAENRPKALEEGRQREKEVEQFLGEAVHTLSPKTVLLKLLLPAISRAVVKTHRAQTVTRMATIACALERYRLAHGTYPASLEDLVPGFLATIPTDWMSGDPFHYRKTDDGWFRLWSIGPDGKDDGGAYLTVDKNGRARGEDLDWPWPVPIKSLEPRLF
jgi:hypothetical protein